MIDELKVELGKEKSTPPPDKYLTKNEAASRMCCSLPTLDRRIEDGLPYRKNGRKLLFTEAEIEAFMDEMRSRQAGGIPPTIRGS
jgi:excisionase family DNA binding protein